MKDIYLFDYNIVAKLDPDYKQYLTYEKPLYAGDELTPFTPVPSALDTPTVVLRRNTPSGETLTDNDVDVVNLVSNTNIRSETPIDKPIHIMRAETSTKPGPRVLYLKPEFVNHKLNGRKICSPQFQLCPPKNVLAPGSVMYEDKKRWSINALDKDRYQDVVHLNKSSVSISGDKIRHVDTAYWFHRIKNVTSEKKAHTKMLVYNKKTKQLYKLYTVKVNSSKTAKRYKYTINNVLMNYRLCTTHLVISSYISSKFVEEIEKVVKQDVPDAFTPSTTDQLCAYSLEMLVLQHKLGKRIDWIDKILYLKASETIHYVFGHNVGYDVSHTYSKSKHRAKISKFIPHLKKYTNYTALIEAVFGHLYHKTMLKLVPLNIELGACELLLHHIKEHTLPKTMFHLLQATLNSKLEVDDKRRILQGMYHILWDTNEVNPSIMDAWVVTALRFVKKGIKPPSTYTWRDMYGMASRYHVRIRPRKFNVREDIQILHDRLVALQNRDDQIVRQYRNKPFLPFTHPDKLYDGFQFVFLGTPEALREEGVLMHHCVGGYVHRCLSGRSIIFSMQKDGVRYVTVEITGTTYIVLQQYTINDNLVRNDEIHNIIEKWEKDVIELHKDEEITYHGLCTPSDAVPISSSDVVPIPRPAVANYNVVNTPPIERPIPLPAAPVPIIATAREEVRNQINTLMARINAIQQPI